MNLLGQPNFSSGLSALVLSIRVLTSYDSRSISIFFCYCFFFYYFQRKEGPRQPINADQGGDLKQSMVRASFAAPSGMEVSRVGPKKRQLEHPRGLPNSTAASVQ